VSNGNQSQPALDRARRKAYLHLLPLLFLCYVIAYVDRTNVSIAKLTMSHDLPAFTDKIIGHGAGLFFIGYFLLEIPGSLLVEKWSARRLLCRIMVTWGIAAALTATVKTPFQFYVVRFLLGVAEAGFFPGVIVYLTHWFPSRDRARALSWFLIGTPVAQIVSPKISNALLKIGTEENVGGVLVRHPEVWGLEGWQWVYIFWGIPAVVLGLVVLFALTDRPEQAKWLSAEEKESLERELQAERARRAGTKRMRLSDALRHPKVLLLAGAYFCSTTANYGVEFFLPSILKHWYALDLNTITWLVMLPPCLALMSQLFVGWNSDRTKERRYHAVVSLTIALVALGLAPLTHGHLPLTMVCFMFAAAGIKGYQPAFWSLPSLFLTEMAAAASIGLINSIGNLGGYLGPTIMGEVKTRTGSFEGALYFLCFALTVCASIIFSLGIGKKESTVRPDR
jgi:ACS family tartrate transporter-like MFS transporter